MGRGQLGSEPAPVLAELGDSVGLARDRLSLPGDCGILDGQPFGQGAIAAVIAAETSCVVT